MQEGAARWRARAEPAPTCTAGAAAGSVGRPAVDSSEFDQMSCHAAKDLAQVRLVRPGHRGARGGAGGIEENSN